MAHAADVSRVLPHAVLAAGLLLGGCARDAAARYPEQWSRPTPAAQNACPGLTGRYHNVGELAAGTPCGGTRHEFRGQYRCDTSLARIGRKRSAVSRGRAPFRGNIVPWLSHSFISIPRARCRCRTRSASGWSS